MLVTVCTKFSEKGKDQNLYLTLKNKIAYFWFPQGIIIFPGGVQQKWNFQRGGGPLFEMILENPEGMGDHRKNSFCVRYRLYGYFQELHNRSLCVQLTNRAHLFHSSSQRERVISVFKRQLAVPLLGTEELFINDTILP